MIFNGSIIQQTEGLAYNWRYNLPGSHLPFTLDIDHTAWFALKLPFYQFVCTG